MIVTEKPVSINVFEEQIFQYCCAAGREIFKAFLEKRDAELRERRDKHTYRHKGSRKRVLKTKLGEVEYERAVYEVESEAGGRRCVYLLDEDMGLEGSGFFSGLMVEEIVRACCAGSFRNAAETVSSLTGQNLSHTAAWKVVQDVGGRVDQQERQAAKLAAQGRGKGTLERKLLLEEQDGVWLPLQGASRKMYGPSRELKVAIAYDGAKQTGKKRYELTNKVACANFEAARSFVKRKEGVIAQTYNIDEIELRFLNGDGASWIRQSALDDNVHFQLDPFHRNKAIRMWVRHPEQQKVMTDLLYSKKIDELLEYIEALTNSVDDSEEGIAEGENLKSLLTYFTNNRDALVPCYRRGLPVPDAPEGHVYRRMGAMESNIYSIVVYRMKRRRTSWSIRGGNNMARLLCLRSTKKLSGTLESLAPFVLPEKYIEEVSHTLSAHRVAESAGKGYNGFHQASIPPKYHWMRDLFADRPISDL